MARKKKRCPGKVRGGGKCEKLDSFFCPKTVKVEDKAKEVVSSPEIKINNIELYFINCILT